MKIWRALLLAALLCLSAQTAWATLAIDGSASNAPSAGTSGTVTLSTTKANDVILMWVKFTVAQHVTSITSANIVWDVAARKIEAISGSGLELWKGTAANIITSEVITVNFSASVSVRLTTYGISGAQMAAPFDPNANASQGNALATVSTISTTNTSTTNPNTMLVAGIVGTAFGTVTRPSGFAMVVATGTAEDVSMLVVSSAQSALTETYSWTGGNQTVTMISDAIQGAFAVPPTQVFPLIGM